MPKRRARTLPSLHWTAWAALFLGIVVAISLLGSRYFPPLYVADDWADDFLTAQFRPFAPQRDDVVLLTIRESTLAQFPFRSPIDRGFLADLLDALDERGVRAAALDILFDQPTTAAGDEAFRAAARRFRAPLVAAWTDRKTSLSERQFDFQQKYLAEIRAGFVNTERDANGTVRDAFAGREEETGWRPGFPLALAQALGVDPPREAFRIDYVLGPDPATPPFRQWPAELAKRLPPAWLNGKIVLIGADLPLEDRFRTPLAASLGLAQGTLPGVLIHAHVLAQLLDGRSKATSDLRGEAAVALALGLAAIGIAVWIPGTFLQLSTAAIVIAALWAGDAALYQRAGIALPLVSPTIAFGCAVFMAVAFVGHRRRMQGQFVREAFGHYVSPAVIKRLEANPDQLGLGGDKRDISVLFTDIEGFTTFAERQEPTVLIGILNRYLDALSAEVQRHDGMIDKFIGDAVMALFGTPDAQPDHADRAVACALGMREVSRRLQAELAAQGYTLGRTRIGVHSGSAVVGNVGGKERFDYTAIGDVVNTGSRLEGANKYFGTDICVSDAVRERVTDRPFRPIGSLVVKGRSEGLPVFSPVAPDETACVQSYVAAYDLIDRDGATALAAFEAHLAAYPDDRLARFQLDRLAGGIFSTHIVLEGK